MSYFIYHILCWIAFLTVVLPYALVAGCLNPVFRKSLPQRLGFLGKACLPGTGRPRLWFHAASVGEVRLAQILIQHCRRLLPSCSIVLTTWTPQGLNVARNQFGDSVLCLQAPLDLPWIVRRFLKTIQPDVYIGLETELWPNMIRETRRSGAAAILLNARLSEGSFRRYRLFRPFLAEVLSHFSQIAAIGVADADRLQALGAPPARLVVTGNAKYARADSDTPGGNDLARADRYRNLLSIRDGQTVLIAGSTHTGEEEMLLDAFWPAPPGMDLLLILAPRHLERLAKVEVILRSRKIGFDRFSALAGGQRRHPVVLVDRMGELANLYAVATHAFCGGSLVPRGGHNIMEPAWWGKAPFYGPSMKDFADAAELLEQAGAGYPVVSATDLRDRILHLSRHPGEYRAACDRARTMARGQEGAAQKQARIMNDILS